jgi:hypothetical protein
MSECTETIGPEAQLGEALAKLPDGGVLCLKPGSYAVSQVVDRSITLRGLGAPGEVVLDPKGRGTALTFGRAAKRVVIERLTVSGAGAVVRAGGIDSSAAELLLREVVLRGNHADGEAPGAALGVHTGQATIEHCRIADNRGRAAIFVGGNAKVTLRQCAIVENRSSVPLVWIREWGQLTLEHVTMAGNQADALFGIAAVAGSKPLLRVADSILAGAKLLERPGADALTVRTLLAGDAAGLADGGGNRRGEPKFVGSGGEPWRPAPDSPARGMAHAGEGHDLGGAPSGTTAGALE